MAAPAALVAGRTDHTAARRAGGLAHTVAHSVGDRAAVVDSVAAVVGMADCPEESAAAEIPTAARAGVPAPCRGQEAWTGDSIPANRRATALAELSHNQFSLIKLNTCRGKLSPETNASRERCRRENAKEPSVNSPPGHHPARRGQCSGRSSRCSSPAAQHAPRGAVAVLAADQLTMLFQTIQLQGHRRGQMPPALPHPKLPLPNPAPDL